MQLQPRPPSHPPQALRRLRLGPLLPSEEEEDGYYSDRERHRKGRSSATPVFKGSWPTTTASGSPALQLDPSVRSYLTGLDQQLLLAVSGRSGAPLLPEPAAENSLVLYRPIPLPSGRSVPAWSASSCGSPQDDETWFVSSLWPGRYQVEPHISAPCTQEEPEDDQQDTNPSAPPPQAEPMDVC